MSSAVEVDAFEAWWDEFVPTGNPTSNSGPHIGDEPKMFETFSPDVEVAWAAHLKNPRTVWTLLDCDGDLYISAGWHHVNRLGYYITEKPWEDRHLQEDILID